MKGKFKLVKKPNLWREALVIFVVCALVFGTAAGVLYWVGRNYMQLYLMEDAQNTMDDVVDNFSEVKGVYGNESSENDISDDTVYMSAYERLLTCDAMETSLGGSYYSSYDSWMYVSEDARYNYLYKLYDYDTMEEVDFSPYVGNPDLTAIITVASVDTGEMVSYMCDDDKLAASLNEEVGEHEDCTDTEEGLDVLSMNIEALYVNGSRFSLSFASDTGRDYDGPGDTSAYTRYAVDEKRGTDDETYAAFVMDGREYYVRDITVYKSIDERLPEETAALDYMAQSEMTDELKQTTAMSVIKTNLDTCEDEEESVYPPELYRAGNVACGKPYDTDREYAAMAGKVTLANGDVCMLLGVCSYDFKASVEKLAGNLAKEAAFATLILGALLTLVIYMPRKSRYDRQEFRRNMTNAMVHDLKTPLMAMSGCAENLAANINTDKREQYARTICENVQKMSSMIDRMLEVDKYEGKRLAAEEKVDMAKLANDVISENVDTIEARGMTATCSGSYVVSTDAAAMKTVLDNLVTNAVRYGNEGGVIDIEMDESGLTVSNTIDSEPEEELASLWKPYVKGSSAREKGGSGLGLFIVKNVLDGCGMKGVLEVSDGRFIVRIKGI